MKKRVLALLLALLVLCAVPVSVVAAGGNTTVYKTRTGECYHTGSCYHLSKSKIQITLQEAVNQGLRPCSHCNPPKLDSSTTRQYSSYVPATPKPTPKPTATPRTTTAPRASEEKKDNSSGWLLAGGGIVAAYLLGKKRGRT